MGILCWVQRQNFLLQLQIANLMSENQRMSKKLLSMSEVNERHSHSLELKAQTLEQDLHLAQMELSTIQTEYEGYKVCVFPIGFDNLLTRNY